MQNEDIAEIVRITTKTVLAQKNSIINEEFDARFHDIKLLMKNYRRLKNHYDYTDESVLEVGAISSMRYKTKLMMSHVDKMLVVYKTLCQRALNPEELRRWEVLYLHYIAEIPTSIIDITERLGIDKRTFYRDLNRAMEDMAVLLFGIEAIGTWKHSPRPRVV